MVSVALPKKVEKQLRDVVQKDYQGDLQIAIVAFLKLHEKYGWKEQFLKDVEAIREEVRRRGGIKARTIDEAIKRYRKSLGASRE